MSEVTVRELLRALAAVARRNGDVLTLTDVEIEARRLLASPAMQQVHARCQAAARQAYTALMWEQVRNRPFDRILAKRFAHLFPARVGDDGSREGSLLSRRMLPGFTEAVTKMIGPDLYDQCQHKAQAVVEAHRRGDETIDWEAIYADATGKALVSDVLVVMAHYFSAFRKRRDWFITVVNMNLAPARPGTADAAWELGERGFHALMVALFHDLADDLRRGNGRALKQRYGPQTVDDVRRFLRRLEEEDPDRREQRQPA